jgi:hypothetical protein
MEHHAEVSTGVPGIGGSLIGAICSPSFWCWRYCSWLPRAPSAPQEQTGLQG